jgi:ERCC4-type nuclease
MFNVIVDTREQQPWSVGTSSDVEDIIVRKLDTGDYSIEGLEDKLCIERKKSVSELATNVSEKRFWAEMERMAKYKWRYLVLEFGIEDIAMFPVGSTIPQHKHHKVRIKGPYIMKCISKIQVDYNIDVIFAGDMDNARWVATNIMKRVYEKTSA